jgi:ubiquinone/menaquinone biosynthesis C-methylase UbiE
MTIEEAVALVGNSRIEWARRQAWCDLGCGEGTFTTALALLLAPGSTIHAVDVNSQALKQVPDSHNGVEIRKVIADLNSPSLRLPLVDGILMANSLHFIADQELFLRKLRRLTRRYLVVEYERSLRSIWGPYPVPFQRLRELFHAVGVESVEQIGKRGSQFGGTMYCAYAEADTPEKDDQPVLTE